MPSVRSDCARRTPGCRRLVTINAPAAIARTVRSAAAASFGPGFDQDGLTDDRGPWAPDAADTRRSARRTDGCTPFTNAAAIAGKIVLRGPRHLRASRSRSRNAENAGADRRDRRQQRGRSAGLRWPASDPTITIPSVTHPHEDRDRSTPRWSAEPVNVTIKDIDTGDEGGLLPLAHRREVRRVRRRHPRHVEPHLLRRPGQGRRTPSTTARQTTAAACTATPVCRTTATRCWSTVARFNGVHRRGHRPHQGRGHLLQGHERVPDAGQRLHRPRRLARGGVRRPDRQAAAQAERPAERLGAVRQEDHDGRLRPGDGDDRGRRAAYGPDRPV